MRVNDMFRNIRQLIKKYRECIIKKHYIHNIREWDFLKKCEEHGIANEFGKRILMGYRESEILSFLEHLVYTFNQSMTRKDIRLEWRKISMGYFEPENPRTIREDLNEEELEYCYAELQYMHEAINTLMRGEILSQRNWELICEYNHQPLLTWITDLPYQYYMRLHDTVIQTHPQNNYFRKQLEYNLKYKMCSINDSVSIFL